MLAFEIFLGPYTTTANTMPKLRKELEKSGLPLLGINLSFLRNLLNYNTPGFPGSLTVQKKLHPEFK